MVYALFTDGAVTHNPGGTASYGYVLLGNEKEIDCGYGIIGSGARMNNVMAEFYAISQGLCSFVRNWDQPNSSLYIYSDSQYVVSQLRLGNNKLIGFQLQQIKKYLDVHIVWIPRSENFRADDLAKRLR